MQDRVQLETTSEGIVMVVWVVAGASGTRVVGIHGDALKVRVSAAPRGGSANRGVEALLHSALGYRAEVISGERQRRKRVLLRGSDLPGVESGLSDLLTDSGDC